MQRLVKVNLLVLIMLALFASATYSQGIEVDTCQNLSEFPAFEREQDATEVEQIYQQINIERLKLGLSAYGYNQSLALTADALAADITAKPTSVAIPEVSVGDPISQSVLKASGYEVWEDTNEYIVETTRSVHDFNSEDIDEIVDTLFGFDGSAGIVQDNAQTMLTSLTYREIGIAVKSRPASAQKVVVVMVGARANELPVVINFGGKRIQEREMVLSFHNENNRPQGSAIPPILGRVLRMELSNPNGGEPNAVNWQQICAWNPSDFQAGAAIDVTVKYIDLNNQEVTTLASQWLPSGEPPVVEPVGPTDTPTPTLTPTPSDTPDGPTPSDTPDIPTPAPESTLIVRCFDKDDSCDEVSPPLANGRLDIAGINYPDDPEKTRHVEISGCGNHTGVACGWWTFLEHGYDYTACEALTFDAYVDNPPAEVKLLIEFKLGPGKIYEPEIDLADTNTWTHYQIDLKLKGTKIDVITFIILENSLRRAVHIDNIQFEGCSF